LQKQFIKGNFSWNMMNMRIAESISMSLWLKIHRSVYCSSVGWCRLPHIGRCAQTCSRVCWITRCWCAQSHAIYYIIKSIAYSKNLWSYVLVLSFGWCTS